MSDTTETAVSITVNGTPVEARPGELLIDAAERNGVYIPRFCYHNRMDPVGMCRMCLVDIDTGRGPALQPSCMVTVAPEMVVETESPRVKKAQDGILEFLLINHPLDCPVCDKGGECPLQDHTMAFGPGESRFVEEKRHYAKPIPISENVDLDRERCILCDRCTRFSKDVAGDTLIHFQDRGYGTQVNTFPDHPFASYFSGNTVQICPVGALTATPYRFKARPWDLTVVESTCQDCAVGCRITIDSSRNEVLRYNGVDSEAVNWSWLCDRGRFGFEAVGAPARLIRPQVREGDELVDVRWTEALTAAARAIRAGLDRSGPEGVAVIGGSRLTNESAYAWAKLAKGVIGTDSVDAQLGDGLPAEAVMGLPRATIEDACTRGGTVLVLGSDPKEELPVLFLRLRDAVTRRGARIVELSPHPTSLTDLAAHSLRTVPGAVHETVEQILAGGELAPVRDLLDAGPLTVVMGRSSVAESADAVVAAAGAVLAAYPEARFLSALRRSNVHGALDMGLTPGLLPGQVDLEAGRDHFSEVWNQVPSETGRDTAAILAAAAEGSIDTLILLGADPLTDFPDGDLAARGLAGARTVVAVDIFANPSVQTADVVLPAAGFAEVSGTSTNLEGRVTVLKKKVTPPGEARPDWMIAAELAFRLGADLGFTSSEEIWAEIEGLSSAHAGITLAALAAQPDGLLAGRDESEAEPAEVEGEPAVLEAEAASPADAVEPDTASGADGDEPAAETPEGDDAAGVGPATDEGADSEGADSEGDRGEAEGADTGPARPARLSFTPSTYQAPAMDNYSLRLVTARKLYDHGTMAANAPSVAQLGGPAFVAANPADLERLGVRADDPVKISSSRGSLTTAVTPDATIPQGIVVMSWNQGEPSPTALIDTTTPVTEIRVETTA